MIPAKPLPPFRKRVRAFARELPGLEQGSVQALHRARVASRRLREIVPLMTLDRATALKFKRRLREVTRTLGEVRELDVLTTLIDDLRRNVRYRPVGLDTLEAAVRRARWTAREQLPGALPLSKLRRLAERLECAHKSAVRTNRPGAASKTTRSGGAWIWALEARMARRAARARRTIDVAGTIYAPDRLHDVRVALKKVRYATELLQEAGLMREADLQTLKAAQDLLGRMHDFDVLMAWGRDALAWLPAADADTRRELNLLLLGLEDDCRRMHGRYMRNRTALISVVERLQAAAARESTPLQGLTVAAPRSRARRGGPGYR